MNMKLLGMLCIAHGVLTVLVLMELSISIGWSTELLMSYLS